MKLFIFSLAILASLAGCAEPGSTSSMGAGSASGATERQIGMCQVLRSYAGRGEQQQLTEACNRQLGQEMCTRCLTSGL